MNIYDIAKQAGVSVTTVSRVLNNNENVKEATRKKVLDVIEGENYVPNSLARNLSVGDSRSIAFLVPDIENPFFAKLLHGITDTAREYDYNVFMYGTDEDVEMEHKVLNSLKVEMMKGLIMIPVAANDKTTAALLNDYREKGIPVILVDRTLSGERFDGVFSEDIEGAQEAIECLIEEGHKDIAIISGPETSKPGQDRLKGYKNALKKHKIEIKEEYIVGGEFKEIESYHAMQQLMELENSPTAVFTANNLTTLGCLKYMMEHHIKLERDISMIGFDDIPELEYAGMKLTVVDRPVYEMGCEAMEMLEKRFQKKLANGKDDLVVRRNTVGTRLIKRGSEKRMQLVE